MMMRLLCLIFKNKNNYHRINKILIEIKIWKQFSNNNNKTKKIIIKKAIQAAKLIGIT